MTSKKIAIYSGAVPSTTFIERLITGIADHGDWVYLFGWQQKKVTYAKNVKQFTFASKWDKLYILIRYTILLSLFLPSDKKKLDAIIKKRKGNSNKLKVKYYPVLYHRPDIFHLQWAKSIKDWIWVQEFGIQLILSLRGTHITISPKEDEKLAQTFRDYFPKIEGFHAVSKSMAMEAQKYGAEKSKIKVVYSGFTIDDFDFRIKTNRNDSLKILSIGRSHWVKGYTYALDVCALLHQKNIDFQYTIIGIDQEQEELLFQRHELGLEDRVVFKDSIPFLQIKDEIQSADILLLPSIEEGIANVALEAMALGTIVISTNCGGMEEVIKDGENGFVVPIRNPEASAAIIQKIGKLSDDDYQKITKNARKTIENHHSEFLMISNMKVLYNTVLNGKS